MSTKLASWIMSYMKISYSIVCYSSEGSTPQLFRDQCRYIFVGKDWLAKHAERDQELKHILVEMEL